MYAFGNPSTKAAFKKQLKECDDKRIGEHVFSTAFTLADRHAEAATVNGKLYVAGPHFPEPHKWYAQIDVVNGEIVRVK